MEVTPLRHIVVEDDPTLRLLAVVLDPEVPAERRQAFADFYAHDVGDFGAWLAAIRARLPGLYPARVVLASSSESLNAALANASALVVESESVDAALLVRAPRLKLVQKFGAIMDNIDTAACAARSVEVRGLRRRANVACAEYALGMMSALARKIVETNGLVTESRLRAAGYAPRYFDRRHTTNSNAARVAGIRGLRGAKLGIFGLGEIGRELANLAMAYEMQISYTQRHRLSPEHEARYRARYVSLENLLSDSDFVTLHLPGGDATRGIIGARELALMKQGAYLINVSRRELVDGRALAAALSGGRLAGYAADFEYQPDRSEVEDLLGRRDVILTPHIAAQPRFNATADFEELLFNIANAI